jgi:Zn-dependent M28 family amino/carboxypeptidase
MLAPRLSQCNHSLRVCFFSAEEWALTGSAVYLDSLAAAERDLLKLNINLDTVAGDDKLTALISEFPALDGFVRAAAGDAGMEIATYLPIMSNSDHYNFARHNIPALRLVAGFDRPDSRVRHILSRQDTRDKVTIDEMYRASAAVSTLTIRALNTSPVELERLAQR